MPDKKININPLQLKMLKQESKMDHLSDEEFIKLLQESFEKTLNRGGKEPK